MYKQMRRSEKKATDNDVLDILKKAEYGSFATVDSECGVYCIYVNYVYYNNAIYFHCAKEGQKLDNIKNDNRVCFSVCNDVKIIKEKFSTEYKSVVVFGKASIIESDNEKKEVLLKIQNKFCPEFEYIELGEKMTNSFFPKVCIVKIDIDHMEGKISNK